MNILTTKTEVERDRWKRPLIVPPGGGKPVAYQRTTRYVAALSDTYNLTQWQRRQVAIGLANRPDLVLSAAACRPGDKAGLDKLCDQAAEAAGAGRAATVGKALHKLTERIDLGEPLGPVPEAHRADIDAYRRTTTAVEPVAVEQFRDTRALQACHMREPVWFVVCVPAGPLRPPGRSIRPIHSTT